MTRKGSKIATVGVMLAVAALYLCEYFHWDKFPIFLALAYFALAAVEAFRAEVITAGESEQKKRFEVLRPEDQQPLVLI